MTEEQRTMTDLEKAYAVLTAKQEPYNKLFDYYDGDQPLKYNTSRLKEIFRNLDINLTENWCSVVIDSTYTRVNLLGASIATEEKETKNVFTEAILRIKERIVGGADKNQEKLDKIVEDNEIILDSDDIHKVAGIIGESYYIVGKTEDGVEGFYNDPRLVHIFYEEENPRKKKFAAKWWVDEDGNRRMVLYYVDHFEYYKTEGKAKDITGASQFMPTDKDGVFSEDNTELNDTGQIPVFHFRVDRRIIKSDLKNIIPPQDFVNKLVSDMAIVAEFGAMRQKWIITNSDIKGRLKNAPNEIWALPAGDGEGQQTRVGDFEANDPDTYIKAIDREVNVISSLSQTPKHFFFNTGTTQISGEALIVLESPLNDKANNRIDIFTPTWKKVLAYMLELDGAKVDSQAILVKFENPETIQPKTRAEIIKVLVESGMPLVTVLRDLGWSQAQIDQFIVDLEEANEMDRASLAQSILDSERRFNNPEENEG
jgi:hypothetical protein